VYFLFWLKRICILTITHSKDIINQIYKKIQNWGLKFPKIFKSIDIVINLPVCGPWRMTLRQGCAFSRRLLLWFTPCTRHFSGTTAYQVFLCLFLDFFATTAAAAAAEIHKRKASSVIAVPASCCSNAAYYSAGHWQYDCTTHTSFQQEINQLLRAAY
jgi:hypothetical protein